MTLHFSNEPVPASGEVQSKALTPGNGRIIRFIRGTLGCGCPPEVFEHIDDDRLPGPPCPYRRIAVGGRLLIYLVSAPTAPVEESLLGALVSAGKAERDHLGMNRFRLVLFSEARDDLVSAWTPVFERLRAGDDRLYLHVLTAHQAP